MLSRTAVSSFKYYFLLTNINDLKEIINILDKEDELFTLIIQKNVIMCEVEGTVLISSLLDGNYIDYKNIEIGDILAYKYRDIIIVHRIINIPLR